MSYYTPNKDPNFWRNNNDEIKDVNCGSYALNLLDWYWPYNYDEEFGDNIIESWSGTFGTFYDALIDSTNYHLKQILNDFEDIRIIHNFDEANIDERIILYREGISQNGCFPSMNENCIYGYENCVNWEWDFHFIWRDIEGSWHQKLGGGEIQEIDEPDFNNFWFCDLCVYQGPIVMLAKKEV